MIWIRGLIEEIPFTKIVGPPWKEGEIRLGVDKVIFDEISELDILDIYDRQAPDSI